jgi:hypothetical protein
LNALIRISSRDFYGEYGRTLRAGEASLLDQLSSGDAEEFVRQDSAVNIELTTVSPPLTELLPRFQADVVVGNLEKARVVVETSGAEAIRCHRSATDGTYAETNEILAMCRHRASFR